MSADCTGNMNEKICNELSVSDRIVCAIMFCESVQHYVDTIRITETEEAYRVKRKMRKNKSIRQHTSK